MITEYQHNLLGRDLIDKFGVLTVNHVKEADTDTVKATPVSYTHLTLPTMAVV